MQTAAHVAPNKTHQIHTRGRGGHSSQQNKNNTDKVNHDVVQGNRRQVQQKATKQTWGARRGASACFAPTRKGDGNTRAAWNRVSTTSNPASNQTTTTSKKKKRRRRTGRQAGNKSTSQLCRPMNRATSLQADIGVAFQAFGPIKNTQTTPLKPFFSN